MGRIEFVNVHLVAGQHYEVLAMLVYLDVIEFLIADSDQLPVIAPAGLFDLSDDNVPASWVFSSKVTSDAAVEDETADISAIWGYPEVARSSMGLIALLNHEPRAIHTFRQELKSAEGGR